MHNSQSAPAQESTPASVTTDLAKALEVLMPFVEGYRINLPIKQFNFLGEQLAKARAAIQRAHNGEAK